MDSLSSGPIAAVLDRLHREADAADAPLMEKYMSGPSGTEQVIDRFIAAETENLTGLYHDLAGNFAFTLYLPILKLLEPRLKPGAIIVGENAFEQAPGYIDYVRDPLNGYVSLPLPFDSGRGNEFTVKTK